MSTKQRYGATFSAINDSAFAANDECAIGGRQRALSPLVMCNGPMNAAAELLSDRKLGVCRKWHPVALPSINVAIAEMHADARTEGKWLSFDWDRF